MSSSQEPTSFSARSKTHASYEEVAFNPPSKLPAFPSSVSKNIVMDQEAFSPRARSGSSSGGNSSPMPRNQSQNQQKVPDLNRRRRTNSQHSNSHVESTTTPGGARMGAQGMMDDHQNSSGQQSGLDVTSASVGGDLDFSFNDNDMNDLQTLKDSIHENIHQLSNNCKRFRQQFDREINLSRKNLEQHLVESFIDIAKNKLPDVYLRSIPKFGGNEVSDALFRTLVAMKKDKQNVIKVRFDQDVIDDISKIVQDNIGDVFYDPIAIFTRLVSSIRNHMEQINHHSDEMELLLVNFKGKNQELEQEVRHLKRLLVDKSEEEEQLKEELHEKDLQMDIIRQQILRRNKQLDDQRSAFHKELTQVKMKLYEKDELGKPITSDDIPVGDFTLRFLQGGNNFELEDNENDVFEEKLQENSKKLEESFRREKRAMKKRHQAEIQEKELEIQGLSNKVIRLQSQLKKLSLMQAKQKSSGDEDQEF